MIRAIIFDCFGVLCTEGWLPFKKKHFGHDPALEQQATDLSKQLNSGFISNEDFVVGIAKLADVSKQNAIRAVQHNAPNEELFSFISEKLKGRYKLSILSNAGGDRLQELFTSEQIALFDERSLSYQTGFVKPDPRAYRQAAEGLGVETQECIFVDDQERHCAGAREAGMQAIVYADFEQFKRELESILGN